MRQTISVLRGIQDLDKELFQVRSELKRLPEERDKRRSQIDAMLVEAGEIERQIHDLRGRIKEIEDLTTGQRQRIRKLEGEMAKARDTALVVAFQHEMKTLRREIGEAEEEGLEFVTDADDLAGRKAEIDAIVTAEEEKFAEYNGNVELELVAAREREEGLAGQRKGLLAVEGMSIEVLAQYEKLLNAREGGAMAPLESKTCQGCYTAVPNNLYVRLARGADLVTCPSCTRILYLP